MKEYYRIQFNMNQQSYYLLWYTDDEDGFYQESAAQSVYWTRSIDEIQRVIDTKKLLLANNNITEYNFDDLENTIRSMDHTQPKDCNYLIDFWNIISDFAKSSNSVFKGNSDNPDILHLYNKLFYGCNLDAMRGENDLFVPIWTTEEIMLLIEIFNNGIFLIENTLG